MLADKVNGCKQRGMPGHVLCVPVAGNRLPSGPGPTMPLGPNKPEARGPAVINALVVVVRAKTLFCIAICYWHSHKVQP